MMIALRTAQMGKTKRNKKKKKKKNFLIVWPALKESVIQLFIRLLNTSAGSIHFFIRSALKAPSPPVRRFPGTVLKLIVAHIQNVYHFHIRVPLHPAPRPPHPLWENTGTKHHRKQIKTPQSCKNWNSAQNMNSSSLPVPTPVWLKAGFDSFQNSIDLVFFLFFFFVFLFFCFFFLSFFFFFFSLSHRNLYKKKYKSTNILNAKHLRHLLEPSFRLVT